MNQNIKNVIDEIQPLRDELKNHELYQSLKSIEDIRQRIIDIHNFMIKKVLKSNDEYIVIPVLHNPGDIYGKPEFLTPGQIHEDKSIVLSRLLFQGFSCWRE